MNNTFKKILAPIASLRLTVVLLSLAMIVILAGTTAQEHMGIWQVQSKYFHSFFCWIELDLLAPLVQRQIPGSIPMLGGYSLIILLLANLLTAHALRFKVSPWDIVLLPALGFLLAVLWAWQNNHADWLMAVACVVSVGFLVGLFMVHKKRGGVILIHLGLILLLVGEMMTSLMAVESRMQIDEGSSSNYSYDIREPELVLQDTSSPHQNQVFAIDNQKLKAGEIVTGGGLPAGVEVKVERFYPNSTVVNANKKDAPDAPAVTVDAMFDDVKVAAIPKPRFTGAGEESKNVDTPSAYVTISKNGQSIGTYLATTMLPSVSLNIDGKPFDLSLRFRRYYLPYRLELQDFRFDRYVGTNTPKNYSSLVRLVDPARSEDREINISMNEPLRHAGLTFYQSSFDDKTETTTELQVVRNPGWLIPYVSCVIGGIGMIAHFGIALFAFLRKFNKRDQARILLAPLGGVGAMGRLGMNPPKEREAAVSKSRKKDSGADTSYTLEPQRNWTAVTMSAAIGAIAIIYLISVVARAPEETSQFNLAAFGQIPVSYGGRQQPLDSLARNHLKVISGREEFKDENGVTQPAIVWLLDLFTQHDGGHKVFRIDHPGIKSILAQYLPQSPAGEPAVMDRKLFSTDELRPAIPELQRQVDLAGKIKQTDRDLFQQKVLNFSRQVHIASEIQRVPELYIVPPMAAGQEWRQLGQVFEESRNAPENTNPAVLGFVKLLQAYSTNDPQTFNAELPKYRALVEQHVPAVVAKTDFETRFNLAAPFIVCMALYVGVFLLAVGSWLGWREPLRRGAFVLLVITLAFHTLALTGRIYISGRPPVTNLYSSAIFIAWGTALFSTLLEKVYKNGVGCVTAAVTAFPSLLIAHYLSFSGNGDTMEVLQAVLDTNFWLATHVVAITLGYAATFLAGFLSLAYIVLGIATPMLKDEVRRKSIARMIYGTLCFAILLSFVGTVLGGIWADQSWGRFWGWDPKENGAVLIVLWNAVVLHARWGGLVRERGLACLAIFGNVVTAWSWFGTNMLGVGLHSYGFMESAVFWLASFVFLQVALILIGNIPQKYWMSLRTEGAKGRGFEPRMTPPSRTVATGLQQS